MGLHKLKQIFIECPIELIAIGNWGNNWKLFMVNILLFGLFVIFFIMGHSTLLFFRSRDLEMLSMRQLIFPWPKSGGRFVSILCFFVSLVALLLCAKYYKNFDFNHRGAWRIAVSLIVGPCVIYMIYIFGRIRSRDGCYVFDPNKKPEQEWRWAMSVMIFLGLASMLF